MQIKKKILVTRPEHQAHNLCYLIEQQGWQALRFPVLDIQAKVLTEQDIQLIQHIELYRYVFFVSVNAVNFGLPLLDDKKNYLQTTKKISCIAVGKATLLALAKHRIHSALSPIDGFNTEALLALPELQTLTGQRCLIIRGQGGRELLAESLRDRGAKVDYLEVYRRIIPCFDSKEVEACLLNNLLAAVLIYSGDALHHLVQMLDKQEIKINLLNVPLVVISDRVYTLAKKIGFKSIIVAEQASDTAMINALLNEVECG